MKNRPWPIIVLAAIQIFMPIFSLVMNAAFARVSPALYFQAFVKFKTPLEILEFFALFPIAGIAIYLTKKWSYPVFLLVMGWTIYSNIEIWLSDYQGIMSPWLLVAILTMNIAFVTYYLLPSVRRPYFDQRIRWWESQPRFLIEIPCQITINDKTANGNIRDLSVAGAFIESEAKCEENDVIHIEWSIYNLRLRVDGQVVHTGRQGKQGYGIRFNATRKTKKIIARQLEVFEALGCHVSRLSDPKWTSFTSWIKGLIHGKGFLPEVPDK